MWPSETLVRLLKGSYVPGIDQNFVGKKVLDVSCGTGNNLCFLATLGLELYATEISDEICEITTRKLAARKIPVTMKAGTNRQLPFETGTFDLLTSWNVIHYEDNEQSMIEAIREYARVLKPGGRFIISTTGPDHLILKDSTTLGNHRYKIGRDDDFRKGQVYFYFDAPNYIHYYFDKDFRDVLVGRTRGDLFSGIQDYWIITGIK